MRAPFVVVLAIASCASPARPITSAPRAAAVTPAEAAPAAAKPVPPDRDHDGVADEIDACPDEPATPEGAGDGCPKREVVVIATANPPPIELVEFAPGNAAPVTASQGILDAIADTMKAHPEIVLVQVEGHADPKEKDPVVLSQRRADAVVKALVDRGVPAARLRGKGFGALCPRALAAAVVTRRAEVKVAKSTNGSSTELGCPAATAAGVVSDPVP